MLINTSTQSIIRVLLNEKDRKFTLRELAAKAKVSLGMAVKITNTLESTGYISKKRGISVLNWEKLLKAWSYTLSINENEKIEFLAPERPQYLIKKISNLLRNKVHAFTLFSATELIAPYVAPDKVHIYIFKDNENEISKIFVENGIMKAEKGNVVCYMVDETYFYGNFKTREIKIISLPQLYVDLFSYGGRGEEAAEHILKLMRQ